MSFFSKKLAGAFILLVILSLVLITLFSFFNTPVIHLNDLFGNGNNTNQYIFFYLRLPKLILAFLVGASLSVSGLSFQALLKNPLADPYILGISGGAALGYVLAIVLGLPFVLIPVTGFVFALLSLLIIYKMSCQHGVLSVMNLLLVGIVFNAFSFALILVVNSVANFAQAQQILYLLLGSIDPISWDRLLILTVFIFLGLLILFLKAKKINILSLGDEDAFHLGVNVNREKKIIFVVTSLLVGASVSLCGLIGFIGLIVPHITRLIFGADNRKAIPAAVLTGGILLMSCDFVASNLFSFDTLNTKLPVGAITALLGAPMFVYLLKRHAGDKGQGKEN